MNPHPGIALEQFVPTNDFLIAIDSDGCVFDSMEIKHKECFIPAIIEHFGLQAVSKYAREAAEFVNLYSQSRGCNRFLALLEVLDLLSARKEILDREVQLPQFNFIRSWIQGGTNLSEEGLSAAFERSAGEERTELEQLLHWSRAVNATISRIVHGVPPFPFVRQTLAKAALRADLIVCSATPGEALAREWAEHSLAQFVAVIAGQEMGNKTQQLKHSAGGNYLPTRVLMIGDAPGDLKAAQANGVLFYPILPGGEEASWQRLHDEALDRFLNGVYAGAYEQTLIREFLASLPVTPPWQAAHTEERSSLQNV